MLQEACRRGQEMVGLLRAENDEINLLAQGGIPLEELLRSLESQICRGLVGTRHPAGSHAKLVLDRIRRPATIDVGEFVVGEHLLGEVKFDRRYLSLRHFRGSIIALFLIQTTQDTADQVILATPPQMRRPTPSR